MMRHPADGKVHFSELKQHSRSPAHVRHACEHAREMTRPMTVGAIADCIVFGQRGFKIYPGKVRNGSEWERFKAMHEGQILCIQSEYEDAAGAAAAVLADPVAQRLLDGCEFQRVMQWDAYGLPCAAGIGGERGGFDAINVPKRYIADLKITANAEPEALSKHALTMLWHAQGAWYCDGAQALCLDASRFYIIAVEATPPHPVTVLEVPAAVLDMGRRSIRMWAERHRACEQSGEWPGYVQSEMELIVPPWMQVEE